jgi:hypothetical protein
MEVDMKRGVNIKRKLVLVVVTVAFLAGFGALLHSPPSVIDVISGATPKAKRASQAAAQLEGSYIFCFNTVADDFVDHYFFGRNEAIHSILK